jgi:hypothetical protein
LVVLSALLLWSYVGERKAIDGDDTTPVVDVVKTQILDVREFFQSKDNGMEGDQEQWFLLGRIQLRATETNSVSGTTSRVRW